MGSSFSSKFIRYLSTQENGLLRSVFLILTFLSYAHRSVKELVWQLWFGRRLDVLLSVSMCRMPVWFAVSFA